MSFEDITLESSVKHCGKIYGKPQLGSWLRKEVSSMPHAVCGITMCMHPIILCVHASTILWSLYTLQHIECLPFVVCASPHRMNLCPVIYCQLSCYNTHLSTTCGVLGDEQSYSVTELNCLQ